VSARRAPHIQNLADDRRGTIIVIIIIIIIIIITAAATGVRFYPTSR
jgi:flagellar basal body-associated protein FliL